MISLGYWIKRIYNEILNGRTIFQLVVNFLLSFSPVVLWLTLFKNASLIPISWRPKIVVKWLPLADDLFFNVEKLTSILCFVLLTLFLVLPIKHSLKNNSRIFNLVLILTSWPLLNILHYFAVNLEKSKLQDIISYVSYVFLHLIVPIVTSVYLYIFQIPGVLSLYSFCLGLQNISALSTHILLPSSPPWFIHLNGINATADYNTLGYAAGLTRLDATLGTNLATNGFHKSPIVFGAFPSVHSAMAVLTCLFINHFSEKWLLRSVSFLFVSVQWWATMYLDHHWRLDLFAGMLYSITSFHFFKWLFPKYFATQNPSFYSLPQSESTSENIFDSDVEVQSFDLELQSLQKDSNSTIDLFEEKLDNKDKPLFYRVFGS